jgi:hypothetical protein
MMKLFAIILVIGGLVLLYKSESTTSYPYYRQASGYNVRLTGLVAIGMGLALLLTKNKK